MALLPFFDFNPFVDTSAWVASSANVIGKVAIGSKSSVWFQVVVRGDVNSIIIGKGTNIQDGAVIHGSYGKADTIIGDYVTIGHNAIIHGCTLHDYCLVGMGATVLDDAIVPSDCLVAAGSVVLQGSVLDSGWLYAGVPAKKVKQVSVEHLRKQMTESANGYILLSEHYKSIGA